MPPIPVPKFKKVDIQTAERCALELWQGRNYVARKRQPISEEALLIAFAGPCIGLVNVATTGPCFSVPDCEILAKASRVGIYKFPPDYQNGIQNFQQVMRPTHQKWLTAKRNGYRLATTATFDFNRKIEPNAPNKSGQPYERFMIANRILFFALPDMPFFVYTKTLAGHLGFSSKPRTTLGLFNQTIANGLKRNKVQLSKLSLPPPKLMNKNLWTFISNTDWWQRRVLDIALINHFINPSLKKHIIHASQKATSSKAKKSRKVSTKSRRVTAKTSTTS